MILVIITDCIFYELIATNFAELNESNALRKHVQCGDIFQRNILGFYCVVSKSQHALD